MKFKKFLSLLLSVASLNLSTNFSHCFGIVPNDYSVTEVILPGFTNCPNCGAQRPSKISTFGHYYVSKCFGCGSVACLGLGAKTGKKYTNSEPTNVKLSCLYCGCRRFHLNGKKHNEQMYQCANCRKSGYKHCNSQKPDYQTWKVDFCKDCNKLDGFISDKLISGSRDIHTNKRVNKEDKIKGILSNPNGFKYYCYTCKKWKNITLTTEQAKLVCAKYDRCLLSKYLPR